MHMNCKLEDLYLFILKFALLIRGTACLCGTYSFMKSLSREAYVSLTIGIVFTSLTFQQSNAYDFQFIHSTLLYHVTTSHSSFKI